MMLLIIEIALLIGEVAVAWFILGLISDLNKLRNSITTLVEDNLHRKVEYLKRPN